MTTRERLIVGLLGSPWPISKVGGALRLVDMERKHGRQPDWLDLLLEMTLGCGARYMDTTSRPLIIRLAKVTGERRRSRRH